MKMSKKSFILFLLILWGGSVFAQDYGILVNDTVYFAASYSGKDNATGTFDEYLAHVQLTAGDHFVLCNKAANETWTVALDQYTATGFSRNTTAGYYTTTNTGCYDFYIKLKYAQDQLYIGPGSNCTEGVPYIPKEPCDESYGLLVDGVFVQGVKNTAQTEWTEYMVRGVQLTEGQTVQVYDTCNQSAWVISQYAETSCAFPIQNNMYVVEESGTYDFYIKFIYGADEIYIAKDGQGCGASGSGSSVPSQCGDVMMQGFFWDSYAENDPDKMTDVLGDTRWKSMLGRADEIGAYFDLIWLPPSAYASGTGYHPRQYSNQNSDWGSRNDLEKLIATFHNSGTKVVADMVVNHLEAMASWCDFAVQDFGEYGTFQPDGSYICRDDEMNDPANNTPELAGECYGTATGAYDDGYGDEKNYAAARDLAHDEEHVRVMLRAYAKWLINVMHYDGFRYDYCKGFHSSHINDYNQAGGAYISFMEMWAGNDEIIRNIRDANYNTMALDFQTKYSAFDGIAGFDYSRCQGSGLLGQGMSRYAVTFIDSHDWHMRGNGGEFGGNGNSLTPIMKDRLLQANAFLLSMPGVPCVFYPHWAMYKEYIKPMINARHLAGVHSESAVSNEIAEHDGYQATIQGKNGYLILCLGNKANNTFAGYQKVAYGNGYAIWVQANGDVAPGIIATHSTTFEDSVAGIDVTIQAVGGSGNAVIYYTTDGTDPTTESAVYTDTLNFTETTTLKVLAVCGTAQSRIQTYTYTYREPLQHGIRVRFQKPAEWNKVYIYAWIPGEDEEGNPTSENVMGAYPGQRIYQDAEGWFSYEFDNTMKTVHFCISSGDDCPGIRVRSNDLEADYDVCYGWREGKETDNSEEVLLDCETVLSPDFDLVIAPESGFFHNQAEGQEVTIRTVGAPNAMIYYTTDGTEPSTASQTAQGEVTFTVNQTTTVKAYAALDKDRTQTYQETYTYKAPQQGPLTVKFIKPEEWENLYIYAFTRVKVGSKDKDTPYALDGVHSKWPGIKWTQKDGEWYTYTMPADLKEIYVIFTEGDKKPQTQDIFLDEDACYVWNPECWRAALDVDCDGIVEGIEEVIVNSKENHDTYKLIIEGRLVIVHNGVMYDIFGRKL